MLSTAMLPQQPMTYPTWSSTSTEQATRLRESFFNVLQQASARRLVEMLDLMHAKRLRLGLGYLERNWQAEEWKARRQHVLEKTQRGQASLETDTAKEMAELRRAWKQQRDALLRAWGQDDIGRGTTDAPTEEVQMLRRLDKGYRQKLDAIYQGQHESAQYFDSTCKKLNTECNANLQALSFPPCKDASAPVQRRDLHWTVEKPELMELQWSHTGKKPDLYGLPYVVAADLEDQRQVLGPSLTELFGHLDDLPAVALTSSVSAAQPSRRTVEARPYQAAQLLKTALWRSQRRHLRPVFQRMKVTSHRRSSLTASVAPSVRSSAVHQPYPREIAQHTSCPQTPLVTPPASPTGSIQLGPGRRSVQHTVNEHATPQMQYVQYAPYVPHVSPSEVGTPARSDTSPYMLGGST
mmetsp:Transcript_42528/g.77209  ORF Transcript_42528/g.77209 Transcript_42528/m.77209 type:complete len:409 (-) Transcript_42528:22-1248(-)